MISHCKIMPGGGGREGGREAEREGERERERERERGRERGREGVTQITITQQVRSSLYIQEKYFAQYKSLLCVCGPTHHLPPLQ